VDAVDAVDASGKMDAVDCPSTVTVHGMGRNVVLVNLTLRRPYVHDLYFTRYCIDPDH
jgi:hypothetical protein